jgi:hypothetical protein
VGQLSIDVENAVRRYQAALVEYRRASEDEYKWFTRRDGTKHYEECYREVRSRFASVRDNYRGVSDELDRLLLADAKVSK